MIQELDAVYVDGLEQIKTAIQESDELAAYLEEEEEEQYAALRAYFEPAINQIYEEVAKNQPLQVESLEKALLADEFEGLYLPKILGHSVLRGELSDDFKYVRPQEHFKDILLTICNSMNFDILKKRIGQTVQMGFAFSSEIWVTNLMEQISNKKVLYYLNAQKVDRYRDVRERKNGLARYSRQFDNTHYQTVSFPDTLAELKALGLSFQNFIIHRINAKDVDNTSILQPLTDFIANKEFIGSDEHLRIMALVAGYFELEKSQKSTVNKVFNDGRKNTPDFVEKFLQLIRAMHKSKNIDLTPDVDMRYSEIVDRKIDDELKAYFDLLEVVHGRGFVSDEAKKAVTDFYSQYEGRSTVNDCLRHTIYQAFLRYIDNLEPTSYPDYFEITKHFSTYMDIFANQKFNQRLEEASMRYVRKLLKKYTDKRGRDYQDIKKFVARNFVDFKFLTEKEVVELFKTRRKKRVVKA